MEQLLQAPPSNVYEVRIGQAEVVRRAANQCFDEEKIDDAIKLYERSLFLSNFENATIKFDLNNEHNQKVLDRKLMCFMLKLCSLEQLLIQST